MHGQQNVKICDKKQIIVLLSAATAVHYRELVQQ